MLKVVLILPFELIGCGSSSSLSSLSSFDETSASLPDPESSYSLKFPSGTKQTPQITNEIRMVGNPTNQYQINSRFYIPSTETSNKK